MDAPAESLAARAPAWLLPVLLSFVAGYADTVGFVALFGLFSAHVTGNFVLIGATLAHAGNETGGLVSKLLALPVFALAVALATLVVRAHERAGRSAVETIVIAEAVLLAGFLVLGVMISPTTDPEAPLVVLTGMVAVLAMGLQNAAARLLFAKLSPTTVMTGNVTQVVIDTVDVTRGLMGSSASDAARQRVRKMLPPVLAFAVGAIGGALLYRVFGFYCLVLPLIALIVVCFIAREAAAAP